MDVIPAIDLLEGRCVRLYQGDYERSQVFNDNPVDVAKQWVDQGATRLHVVDLDGAKVGHPVNTKTIDAIVQTVGVPVQVGGGLRDRMGVSQLLTIGVGQVILGTAAVEDHPLVSQLCAEFPGKIIVGIDARNGRVATRGWLETSEVAATELSQQMAQLGVAAIIYTDIHRDGTLTGPNRDVLRELARNISVPIIASGGVSSITDLLSLLALEPMGVTGAIVGRALYTGDVSLKEAIQAVGAGRLQDVPPDLGFSTFA
ncbi:MULTISPECIES: 1-(5-phosphoribosyl)-5-[(5-phosphoribosylamino)methylideneamino]imidazole-4-carboxamide isomerase [unclassified Coleofasciculus]|uniref:1-(5-phosphoribosyl)-5-[(5- phosphoribosylamino)methylideneamino]imidazole-4- carboxamide isomerase n=1 Tax=unclassified Coleofasciculus TaxID=2692782 RepID=UPI00187E1C65|nr:MULTISPECIES: 1-(5-phosphoribosyl)-5-[(5-phosphoribosylamino)methylideneamino]imidazole-4-carboxamide isomerase [unclassified Coleofasciculus]MBE9128235.1 1-(5-phosphoribosyl)-5-[(5-phosphoribosylamino)methylideneamino]imidazole-4-carboxamide isomerase [Coleofasciculus sp. LEGE 07081]MBE9147770.1 1-(5-phosphoribosyl)-5-[(5-phosphoribosylamino)methylideneamino]imidazole-4-carboxamide isomerase [Coleofasciculus sp. LEGE 07092]